MNVPRLEGGRGVAGADNRSLAVLLLSLQILVSLTALIAPSLCQRHSWAGLPIVSVAVVVWLPEPRRQGACG